MAYDEDLADRIRELLAEVPGVTEKRMFGGLAFLVDGKLTVAASGQGGILVRVDPDRADRYAHAEVAVMRGKPMPGWLRVSAEHLRTKRQLEAWIGRSLAYMSSISAIRSTKRQRPSAPRASRSR